MFLLTIIDATLRVHTRRIEESTALELPDPNRGAGARMRLHVTLERDGVSVRAHHGDTRTLTPGDRVALDGWVLQLSRDVADGTDRVLPVERDETLALSIAGRRPHALGDRPVVIGSSYACDLCLDDVAVSARHCELTPHDGRWCVWDLGSANGLWVGGVRVPFAVLEAGSAFAVGRTRVELVTQEGARASRAIVGSSPAIERVRADIERVAVAPYAVLIEGESGVGKELVAREIHLRSPRAAAPLVAINCGAIAPELIESELFGHEKGAFSGAVGRRRGVFEEAHGGTLFLDEVGELPLHLQPKLLRALEAREIRRVGGDGTVRVDVRVVSATLRDLDRRVAEGRFREDLFFRLQDFRVRVPALRERPGDIPELSAALLARIARETGRHRRLEDRALARLMMCPWPGNVRELFAVLKRAAFATATPYIGVAHLGLDAPAPPSRVCERPPAWPSEVPLGDYAALVTWCQGNVTQASRISGLARSTIRARIARMRDVEME